MGQSQNQQWDSLDILAGFMGQITFTAIILDSNIEKPDPWDI